MSTPDLCDRAQTNLQLYQDLLGADYGREQVQSVHLAYHLALPLFAGQIRPEGRPFVCHLVGVASILAMLRAAPATVMAGLLHSAFTHGDFGNGMGEFSTRSREAVRRVVGPDVEGLVAAYARQRFDAASVRQWAADAPSMEADLRQIVVIRLANALEDALDGGLELSAKGADERRGIKMEDLVNLARALGYPQLGLSLQKASTPGDAARNFASLREPHRGTYVVGPASWRQKRLLRYFQFASRLGNKISRRLGRRSTSQNK